MRLEMEQNQKVREAMAQIFEEINLFQQTIFDQNEMNYLLKNMHVDDALAVACYFKLGFLTNAKNEKLAYEIIEKIKGYYQVGIAVWPEIYSITEDQGMEWEMDMDFQIRSLES